MHGKSILEADGPRSSPSAPATNPDGGIPKHRMLASGLWPPDTDLALCQRGLKELARVPV